MATSTVHRPRADGTAVDVRVSVIEAGCRWTTSQRQLLGLVVKLDRSGAWALDGSRTCAHWVATALDIEICTAREWIRIGLALERHALLAAMFAEGRLSYSKVRTITRVVTDEFEADLCELAERTPAGRVSSAIAAYLGRHEEPEETEARQHEARSLTYRVEPDGMVVGYFRLPPLAAAVVTGAVDSWVMHESSKKGFVTKNLAKSGEDASADACSSRRANSWPSVAQQRADALVTLIAGGGEGDGQGNGVKIETEIVIHLRADGCTFDDGTPVAGTIVERIAPESFIRALIHDAESKPINASGRQRHPTKRQKRYVRERDGGCVDCRGVEFLESDHVPEFEITLHTLVDELETRCRTCHRSRGSGSPPR